MRASQSVGFASLVLANLVLALPTDDVFASLPDEGVSWPALARRALTPDNTCGPQNNNYSCDPSLPLGGTCCSVNGYCGNSTAYCGTGCQAGFGTCSKTTTVPDNTFQCGSQNANQICGNALCCSQAGYCGNTTDYCGNGCQTAFGLCTATPIVSGGTNGTGPGGVSTDGTCGGDAGVNCPAGQCCSPGGWCGTGIDYCADPTCQYQYGLCDSDTVPAGPSTLNDPRPLLGKVTYTDDLIDCTKDKVVALSYDDGPYLYTNELLDVLKQYGFHATFFITGNNLGKGPIDTTAPYPAVIKRMIAEGHQVASHTWSHYNLSALTTAQRRAQMGNNERALANIIGKYPTYMRPPYSDCSEETGCWADLQALGYHRTYFDLDTADYLNNSPDLIQNSKDIVKSALAQADNNGDYLAIQHDIQQQSVTNLSAYFYGIIKQKGWKGVTVGECLGDAEANWYRTPGSGQAISTSSTSHSSTSTSQSPTAQTTVQTSTIKTVTSTSTSTSTSSSSVGNNIKAAASTSAAAAAATTTQVTKAPASTSTPSAPASTSSTPARPAGSQNTGTCDIQAGNFCGQLDAFTSKRQCRQTVSDCFTDSWKCLPQAGPKEAWACKRWARLCLLVDTYCKQCHSCSLTEFRKLNKQQKAPKS